MAPSQDSTQLIIALVNSVRDDLKSDINDLREEFSREIQSKKCSGWSFDIKHWIFIALFLVSVSFNVGRESARSLNGLDTTATTYKVSKAALSSTYTDVSKYYKLTNGN